MCWDSGSWRSFDSMRWCCANPSAPIAHRLVDVAEDGVRQRCGVCRREVLVALRPPEHRADRVQRRHAVGTRARGPLRSRVLIVSPGAAPSRDIGERLFEDGDGGRVAAGTLGQVVRPSSGHPHVVGVSSAASDWRSAIAVSASS